MCNTKKIYLGTNTKMYKTISETSEYLTELIKLTAGIEENKVELFVIPSFTTLAESQTILKNTNIKLGAQNMCWEERGQYTGEISPIMLKEVGVEIVEIGHSERRHIFGETDDQIEKKVKAAVIHEFTALLCIGETLEQKEYGISNEVLGMQLKKGLHSINSEEAKQIWIAYEPVWAIGVNGIPVTKDYAQEKHSHIRSVLIDLFGIEIGNNIPILYGGSVNINNAKELKNIPNINGLFIGRSAWDAYNFNKIICDIITA